MVFFGITGELLRAEGEVILFLAETMTAYRADNNLAGCFMV